ncbi:unnamed protein product, partial [Caretta caretta]
MGYELRAIYYRGSSNGNKRRFAQRFLLTILVVQTLQNKWILIKKKKKCHQIKQLREVVLVENCLSLLASLMVAFPWLSYFPYIDGFSSLPCFLFTLYPTLKKKDAQKAILKRISQRRESARKKVVQEEKSTDKSLSDTKIYQKNLEVRTETEILSDDSLAFFIMTGEEGSELKDLDKNTYQHKLIHDSHRNLDVLNDESSPLLDIVEEVLLPDVLEVKAAEYECNELRINKQWEHLFVPSSSPVVHSFKLPKGMMPRILEDEGLYIPRKPETCRRSYNKMENRLLKQEGGKNWFEESGEIISLPSPIKQSRNFRKCFPLKTGPGLKTIYKKAMLPELESCIITKSGGQRELYQLDLNISSLLFSHHPLFSQEHVLTARLLQLYECFQNRQQHNIALLLSEKLKALINATKIVESGLEASQLSRKTLEDYQWQIRDTKKLYDLEHQKDISLIHSMLKVWKQIKSVRRQQNYTSTPVKLQFQKRLTKKNDEDAYKAGLAQDAKKDSGMEGEDIDNPDDISQTWGKQKGCLDSAPPLASSAQLAEIKEPFFIPHLTLTAEITAMSKCPMYEQKRRAKYSVIKLARISSIGDVPFLLDENETEEVYLLTSGKLMYSLSWAVDEGGIPLAPESQKIISACYSVPRNINAEIATGLLWFTDQQKLTEWAKEVKIDPNDPEYSDLMEFIMYARSKEQTVSKYFRLEQLQEEFNFVTEEEIKNKYHCMIERYQMQSSRPAGVHSSTYAINQLSRSQHLLSGKSSYTSDPLSEVSVRPFVEVSFQHTVYQTSTADGSHPCWNEELQVDFISPGHDYSFSGLSKIKDNIYVNIFDEVRMEKHEDTCLKGCSGHSYIRKNWFGSVTFPFSALLEQSKICGTFQVNTPPVLLGYTWSKTCVSPKEEHCGQNLKEYTFLTIFATIEPQLSSVENDSESDKFADCEDETLLQRACIFKKNCKAKFPKRRITTSVFDNEGRNTLVTKYIRALNPPQLLLDMYPDDPNATFDLISRFVSLIPCVSDTLNENADVDVWMTSEHCINLAVGNKEEHAVLLCNYLLYFGKKAWVLLGTSVLEGKVAYVLTHENEEYFLWNPLNGQCYKQFDTFCPLQSVDCLINWENVWFNTQQNSSPTCVSFEISKEGFWRQFLPHNFQCIKTQTVQPKVILYTPTNGSMVEELQNRIEKTLKSKIMEWRFHQPTRWHRQCTALLRQILPKLELRNRSFVTDKEENELESLLEHYW